jgi:hypothetical protein
METTIPDNFLLPVSPEQNGEDFTPDKLTAYGDWLEKGERDFIPIRERLDALTYAMAEGWCPPRMIENEIDHLNDVVSGYHCAKYLNETLQTLQDAEADWAAWQQMSPAARNERWDEHDRANAEAAERREVAAQISQRQNAFYAAMFAAGISPIPMADLSEVRLSESDRKLCDAELEISNMGNLV